MFSTTLPGILPTILPTNPEAPVLPFGLRSNSLGLVAYDEALAIQKDEAARVIAGTSPGTIFFVEHPPTFTAGRRTDIAERPTDGTPVVDVDRGGKITWHGPGQLVCYPVIALAEKFDVVGYVRLLEEMMMAALADLGVATIQIPGRSGVWLAGSASQQERKIAAIGVRIASGVTTHGFAINCNPDLSWFERIIPCGITDAGVTSLSRELMRDVTMDELIPIVEKRLAEFLPRVMKGA
ncbi:MAG: lipoyl(octanoyl) transferase LipB [Actinomycetes bacterium]